uniref:Anterior gradient 2 n=1 Tax=Gouania willdenowi TaxID=441366 RepID=A0A8C5DLN3_GOUWI
MVLFHLEDCPHKNRMSNKYSFFSSSYETTDKHLSPDGQYVPRIIFVDPTMTVRADIVVAPPTVCYAYEPSDLKLCKFIMKEKCVCVFLNNEQKKGRYQL